MRLTKEELDAVKKQYGVDRLFSWSMINTYMTSSYEYYLKYIKREAEDKKDSAYAPLGGLCHDQLEKYYSNEIKYGDMLTNFEDGWDVNIDLLDLKFNRSSDEQNESIKNKYKKDIEHFFRHHQPLFTYDVQVEQFSLTMIHGHAFQGYVDAILKSKDGNYKIVDWKTSTIYQGETAKDKAGQLVIYAIGLMQKGIPIEKISIGWNFLKYVTVTYPLKNGKTKVRNIERSKICSTLTSNIRSWMKDLGYDNDDEIDYYLSKFAEKNDFRVLPEDVQDLYDVNDCYVWVDLTKEFVREWAEKISKVLEEIEDAENRYYSTYNEHVFDDTEESIEKNSYYLSNLCGYSINLHKPYRAWLRKKEEGTDIWGNSPQDKQNKEEQFDLSWLDKI